MMTTNKLMKMARKWQQRAALHRKKGSHFKDQVLLLTQLMVDKIRFAFPLKYPSNSVFQELLKISEEEFGLPIGGPITLRFDSVFLKYPI
ncbi:unnamed protein product [Eruca vesicaria subsp. sativa]|uniref:Uncharacterized protein n=1 Tax=Eruca vesicaria subsp. sativa TaxID=29727 RepID=A0ABC8K5K4_ERUVS|nr:unnamed protein product [Eruca vesicaria subsp. sativa]